MSFGQVVVPLGAFCIFFLIIGSTIYVMVKSAQEIKSKDKIPDVIKVVKPKIETVEKTIEKTLSDGTKIILSKKESMQNGFVEDYYAKKSNKKFSSEKKKEKYEAARDKAIAKKIFSEKVKNGEDVSGTINTADAEFTVSNNFLKK